MEALLAGAGAAIVTAVASYLIATRKNSGSVDTADAATIFAEGNSLRQELRDELVTTRVELTSVKKALINAEKDNQISHRKILKLIDRVQVLEKHVKRLGGKV